MKKLLCLGVLISGMIGVTAPSARAFDPGFCANMAERFLDIRRNTYNRGCDTRGIQTVHGNRQRHFDGCMRRDPGYTRALLDDTRARAEAACRAQYR